MKELYENSVVQANDLIRQTNWIMDKVPLKLFKALVSAIDTQNPPKDNFVSVKKRDLIKLLDTSGAHYNYLKTRLRQLTASVKVVDDDEKEVYVALVNKIEWKKETDEIRVRFAEEVMPYLIVTSRFLKYPAADIIRFKSKYGLILFEQLLSRERQSPSGVHDISVEDLRWVTGTTDRYTDFNNFEKRVLKTAVADLNNAGVEILTYYEKIKEKRRVTAIRFFVRNRESFSENDYFPLF